MSGLAARWLAEVWHVLAESGPWLLGGLWLAGLLEALVPRGWVQRHLGGDDLRSVGKAAVVGAPVPLCSCSVLPTAVALQRSGASKGATTAFLVATPETGVDSIGVTWALIDPLMTVARPLAALATAIGSGLAVNGLVRRGWDRPAPPAAAPADAADACCADEPQHAHAPARGGALLRSARYGYGPLLADLTPTLVVGLALAGLIAVFVPPDFFGGAVPHGWPAMLLMLAAGVPLYVCATASTPVAAALMAKGLDPGAALVLLLAGPATNVATLGVVRRVLGGRVTAVYLGSIAVFSLAAGWVVRGLYASFAMDPGGVAVAAGAQPPGVVAQVAGGVLAALLAFHAARLLRRS